MATEKFFMLLMGFIILIIVAAVGANNIRERTERKEMAERGWCETAEATGYNRYAPCTK